MADDRCGTNAGWARHRRAGQPICDPCREAHRQYNAAWKRGERTSIARRQEDVAGRIEDYLYIGGPRIGARRAAERVGVSVRTIVRYNRRLREQAQEAAA